eukprot:6456823-Amphidinium_carterae.2
MKTLRIATAQDKLSDQHIAVVIHKSHGSMVHAEVEAELLNPAPVALFRGFAGVTDVSQDNSTVLRKWERKPGLLWTMPGFETATQTITDLVNAGAFPGSSLSSVLPSPPTHALQDLLAAARVESVTQQDRQYWRLTTDGVASLHALWEVGNPQPVFDIRVDIPLQEMTLYELLVMLQSHGWTWKPWIPPTRKRAFKAAKLPQAYVLGEPLVWCSQHTVCKEYLQLLLRAEE